MLRTSTGGACRCGHGKPERGGKDDNDKRDEQGLGEVRNPKDEHGREKRLEPGWQPLQGSDERPGPRVGDVSRSRRKSQIATNAMKPGMTAHKRISRIPSDATKMRARAGPGPPERVTGPVKPEGLAESFFSTDFERIASREGLGSPCRSSRKVSRQDDVPRCGNSDDRRKDGSRDPAAQRKFPSFAQFVSKISREELDKTRCAVAQALDNAEGKDRRTEG